MKNPANIWQLKKSNESEYRVYKNRMIVGYACLRSEGWVVVGIDKEVFNRRYCSTLMEALKLRYGPAPAELMLGNKLALE